MNATTTRGRFRPLVLALLLALAAALLPAAGAQARTAPLPREIADLARRLETNPPREGDKPDQPTDYTAVATAPSPADARIAREAEAVLRGSREDRSAVSAEAVQAAADLTVVLIDRAREVGITSRQLRGAQRHLDLGLDLLARGDHDGAAGEIGDAYADASSTVTFDVDTFEQNLRDAFDGEAVGYTYAIGEAGVIVAEDGVGEARTAPDSPAPQYANKQVQVASVSKTLTAILILRLMEETGVQPADLIAPYLPGNWTLGDGMDQVTFEQLLTHTSGFKQLANSLPSGTLGHDYAGLQTMVGLDLTAGDGPYTDLYTNLNFSLLRVLAAGLMGIDPVDYPEFEGETLTASAFAIYLDSVYGSIGVPTSCTPTDATPTLMYQWPLDGATPGGESSDKVLTCGAFGFFISAHELVGVLSNLRYSENLISEDQLDVMRDGLLGLQSWSGDHGTYYGHGGQWNPGMQSCVMMFPIAVDVAITVNSIGGSYPSPCTVARIAFDDAWVAA